VIVQLLYTSRATAAMTDVEWRRIEEISSVHNALNSITGLLVFDDRRIMQLLEGRDDRIDLLFGRIEHDRRNCEVVLRYRQSVAFASYGEWAMRLCRMPDDGMDANETLERLMAPSLSPQLRNLMLSWGGKAS